MIEKSSSYKIHTLNITNGSAVFDCEDLEKFFQNVSPFLALAEVEIAWEGSVNVLGNLFPLHVTEAVLDIAQKVVVFLLVFFVLNTPSLGLFDVLEPACCSGTAAKLFVFRRA